MGRKFHTLEAIDWSGCSIVRREPGKLGGAPNLEGMRISPQTIVDHYEGGYSIDQILEFFGGLTQRHVRTILDYASQKGYLERPFSRQQKLSKRTISLVILGSNYWATVEQFAPVIIAAIGVARPGSYQFIEMPVERTKSNQLSG